MSFSSSNTVISVSKLISNFFNPIISLLIFYIYVASKNHTFEEALRYILPLILIAVIPILAWIIINVKKGKYTNMDVSDRKQRNSLYYFIIGALVVYLSYYYIKFNEWDFKILYLLILLVLMFFSNHYIKSSMHTGLNIFVAALFYAENPCFGWIWLILSVIVGVTRVILKRHSIAEVFSGSILAFIVSIFYLYSIN